MQDQYRIPNSARWLGYAGLMPFFGLAMLAVFGRNQAARETALTMFIHYGAVIAAFLGGIRWGAVLASPSWRTLSLAVAPALIAFGLVLLPKPDALKFFALLFALLGLFDVSRRASVVWPHWFRSLRLQLSVAVVTCHLVLIYLYQA
jgi:hypothetical protein